MKDEWGIVEEITALNPTYWLLKIKLEDISRAARPGQFVMLRISSARDPVLRRPFGILKASYPYIWLYFQVVGNGTAQLAEYKAGDKILVLGPLGNGFPDFSERTILLPASASDL